MNQKTPHIRFEQINGYVLGEAKIAEQTSIAEHLASCAMCAMQKKRIEQMLATMRTDQTEEVPTYLSERVFDMFESTLLPVQSEQKSVFDKISAIFHSDEIAPALGLRSGQADSVRRIKYVANEIEITLRISLIGENDWRIDGQVSGANIPDKVELSNKDTVIEAEINDFAEFSLASVKAGKYVLYVTIDDYEIEVKELLIGQ